MIVKETRPLSKEEKAEIEKLEKQKPLNIQINVYKQQLTRLSEDIIQDQAGEIVPDIEQKKALFIEIHSKLRKLEGKEPRAIK